MFYDKYAKELAKAIVKVIFTENSCLDFENLYSTVMAAWDDGTFFRENDKAIEKLFTMRNLNTEKNELPIYIAIVHAINGIYSTQIKHIDQLKLAIQLSKSNELSKNDIDYITDAKKFSHTL